MLVILMSRSLLLVVGMVVIVIMGMTVGQIPMGVLVIMLDHGRRGLAPQTSATFAHMNLLEPCGQAFLILDNETMLILSASMAIPSTMQYFAH
jgi:hypothetical protein